MIIMAKKEVKTDAFVRELLKSAGIMFNEQGSDNKEINEALSVASKSGTGKTGFPEFVALVKDFVIVIEDKADIKHHIKLTEACTIDLDTNTDAVKGYAVNGAVHYAKFILEKTNFKKVFAIGISGTEKHHKIQPIFVESQNIFSNLDDIETFISFNETNIDEYYKRQVLKELSDVEKTTEEVLKDAKTLNEDLRNYANIKETDKPLVVSGILLALDEIEKGGFNIDSLTGDDIETDGEKIYNAINNRLKRSNVSPETKKDKLLSQFMVIKNSVTLSAINNELGKTPIKYFTEYLYKNIYNTIKYVKSSEDYLGMFYGEFLSYGGSDGNGLGIVLTPKHITELFCDLAELKATDIIFDPCCGTAGFLVAGMHRMFSLADGKNSTVEKIKRKQLYGFELQDYMFAIAVTNMILRNDGQSNLKFGDFLAQNPNELQIDIGATIGFMNPPYSQAKKTGNRELCELAFVLHLLNSLKEQSKCVVIIPQSTMTGKTEYEKDYKEEILKNHTLEGVISLNKETFYRKGVIPCIAIFTAHKKHEENYLSRFINFEDDGYYIAKHVGLLQSENAIDKQQYLLDVWRGNIKNAPSKFCVDSAVTAEDEWLHSYFYFNDEVPEKDAFENVVANYLTFETNMIMRRREDLFLESDFKLEEMDVVPLEEKEWKAFKITDIFSIIKRGRRLKKADHTKGNIPYVSSTALNNGVDGFIGNKKGVRYSNCLTVANSGSVGSSFYHPYEFIASDHVTALINPAFNKFIYLFISVLIERFKEKYNFNREINDKRIQREIVMLPIAKNNMPDYEYMEGYIKNVMYSQAKTLVKYFNNSSIEL